MNTEVYEFIYGIHISEAEVPESGIFEVDFNGVLTLEIERDEHGFKLTGVGRDYCGEEFIPTGMFTYSKVPNKSTKTQK